VGGCQVGADPGGGVSSGSMPRWEQAPAGVSGGCLSFA
jgi:hypothetical protein